MITDMEMFPTPQRRYDSRDSKGPNPIAGGETRYIYMGADAESKKAVFAHVDAIGGAGNLRFWDGVGPTPSAVSLGFVGGYGQSFVATPLTANPATGQLGHVCVYAASATPTHVVIDVVGFGS